MSRLFELPMTPEELHEAALWWSEALQVAGAGFRARLDMTAKHTPDEPPEPLTDFDRHFMQHVCPQAEPYILLGSYLLGQNLETFSDALVRVLNFARKRGLGYLSDAGFRTFNEWVQCGLIACIDQPPPDGVVSPERLAEITGRRQP